MLNGEAAPSSEFNLPDATNISSFRTTGEIATFARLLGPFFGFLAQDFLPGGVSQSEAIAAAALIYGNTADAQQAVGYLNSYGGSGNPVDLHSQALMVMLTFAESEGFADWQHVAAPLMDSLFDSEVAEIVGTDQLGGYGSGAAKMMDVIAYSVLDEGELVFGNTGIRALFNDANELGVIVAADKVSEALDDSIPGLMQAIVQFAGLMAYRKINYDDYLGEEAVFHSEKGILTLSANGEETSDGATADLLEVVLAAPDIDVDVFRSQLHDIGRMQRPITLLVSNADKALAVSNLVGGERPGSVVWISATQSSSWLRARSMCASSTVPPSKRPMGSGVTATPSLRGPRDISRSPKADRTAKPPKSVRLFSTWPGLRLRARSSWREVWCGNRRSRTPALRRRTNRKTHRSHETGGGAVSLFRMPDRACIMAGPQGLRPLDTSRRSRP